jgi:ATP-binding cassette subfamily F protein 3
MSVRALFIQASSRVKGIPVSLITATNLSKSYGATEVFTGVSFQIPRRARIAIVGANGIGKTTLLRILAGEEKPSAGKLRNARDLAVGYLPQEAGLDAAHTLWDECLQAFADLRDQEMQLAQLEKQLGQPSNSAPLLEHYGHLQAAFEDAGGYSYETRIRQTLAGLGFAESDLGLPLPHLSGGQRTRALLARLLLSDPELLILDEPTNHLDIGAVEWLESCLRSWKGAALIVSHDRYFLDKVVDHIWEMRRAGLETFRGNYTAFVQQRQARREDRARHNASERERLEKELDFVRRNMAGRGSLQAKGRLRRLSRTLRAIEVHGFDGVRGRRWLEVGEADRTMGVEEAGRRLKALRGSDMNMRRMKLTLAPTRRSGDIILKGRGLRVGYPGKRLFSIDELLLRRCECAALIGGNGSGKTTFLRTLLGRLPALAGELVLGASLDIGYFAQAHEDLDPDLTLIEEIERVRPQMLPANIRHHLGRFSFSGDEHFKKVSVLSGGERGRLALAKLALTEANLLLLDEPTNHLDIPSQEILQEMLGGYAGTVLLVSHDRYLIDALATQVWSIDQERARLDVFEGSYGEYKAWLESGAQRAGSGRVVPKPKRAPAPSRTHADPAVRSSKRSQKQRLERIRRVEGRISDLEEKLAMTARQLESPPADLAAAQRLGAAYTRLRGELDEALAEWEKLHGTAPS